MTQVPDLAALLEEELPKMDRQNSGKVWADASGLPRLQAYPPR